MKDLITWIREKQDAGKATTERAIRHFGEDEVNLAIRSGDVFEGSDGLRVTPGVEPKTYADGGDNDGEPPAWWDILDEPFVVLILGRRGSGKTALGHRFLEEFGGVRGEDADPPIRDAYVMGYPPGKMDLLPEWINHLPANTPPEDWPEGAIVLVTEAHHLMHARRSMKEENLDLDRLVTISRQRDLDIVLDTQYARRLDVTGVMGATAMVWRYPSLMQEDFERRALRKFVREAKEALDEYVNLDERDDYTILQDDGKLHKHAYVFAERFRGVYPRDIKLPEYWSDELSDAVGAKPDNQEKTLATEMQSGGMAKLSDVGKKSADDVAATLEAHGIDTGQQQQAQAGANLAPKHAVVAVLDQPWGVNIELLGAGPDFAPPCEGGNPELVWRLAPPDEAELLQDKEELMARDTEGGRIRTRFEIDAESAVYNGMLDSGNPDEAVLIGLQICLDDQSAVGPGWESDYPVFERNAGYRRDEVVAYHLDKTFEIGRDTPDINTALSPAEALVGGNPVQSSESSGDDPFDNSGAPEESRVDVDTGPETLTGDYDEGQSVIVTQPGCPSCSELKKQEEIQEGLESGALIEIERGHPDFFPTLRQLETNVTPALGRYDADAGEFVPIE